MSFFSTEELLQYLYGETTPAQSAAIESAMQQHWSLREKFETLKATRQQLDEVKHSPRRQTIDFIKQYAAAKLEAELTPQA